MYLRGANSLLALVLGASLSAQEAAPTPAPTPSPAAAAEPEALSREDLQARERAALLVVQSVLAAEKLYAAANGSYFDDLRCLGQPWACIPGFPPDAAPFLDPTYDWLEPRLGHARAFHPGPRATPEEIARAGASPSSLEGFAFTIAPLRPGASGLRAFCGDSRGRVCVRADGLAPPVKNGLCDPCKKLE
jgi:hypothetical protein